MPSNNFITTPNISRQYNQLFDFSPKWSKISYAVLMSYGVHIGHSYKNSSQYCGWMVLGLRQGLHLINLFKFIYMLRAGLFAIEKTIRAKGPVWFVNLDGSSSLYVKKPAAFCGEYWVTENWIRGMVTNYPIIRRSMRRIYRIGQAAWNRKVLLLDSNFSRWGYTRNSWPRALFVSNVLHSYAACHESHKLKIPCLGIVDTNSPTKFVSIAIPGNDESASCLIFYNSLLSTFILYKKFSFVYRWYNSCLTGLKGKVNFKDWIEKRITTGTFPKVKLNIFPYKKDNWKLALGGLNLYTAQGLWQNSKIEYLSYGRQKLSDQRITVDRRQVQLALKQYQGVLTGLAGVFTTGSKLLSVLYKRTRSWYRRLWVNSYNSRRPNRFSGLRPKRVKGLLAAYPRDFYNRRFLSKVAKRVRAPAQFRKLWAFYHLFSALYLPVILKHKFLFTRRFTRRVPRNRYFRRGKVRFPWYMVKFPSKETETKTMKNVNYKRHPFISYNNKEELNYSLKRKLSVLNDPSDLNYFKNSTKWYNRKDYPQGKVKRVFQLSLLQSNAIFTGWITNLFGLNKSHYGYQPKINNKLRTAFTLSVNKGLNNNSVLLWEKQFKNK